MIKTYIMERRIGEALMRLPPVINYYEVLYGIIKLDEPLTGNPAGTYREITKGTA